MKLKEMILVTNDGGGTESKYLTGIENYMESLFHISGGSVAEVAHAVKELCRTKENSLWTEVTLSTGETSHARFCKDEQELRNFLMGIHEMTGEGAIFDKDRCAEECLEVLTAYDMDSRGHPLMGKLHYERLEYSFRQGETLHNLNGSDYSVLMVLDRNDLFLMALSSGQFLIAEGTKAYARYPKEGTYPADSVIRGIEWDRGIYLGNDLSEIDLDSIRREYARDWGQEESGTDDELER